MPICRKIKMKKHTIDKVKICNNVKMCSLTKMYMIDKISIQTIYTITITSGVYYIIQLFDAQIFIFGKKVKRQF